MCISGRRREWAWPRPAPRGRGPDSGRSSPLHPLGRCWITLFERKKNKKKKKEKKRPKAAAHYAPGREGETSSGRCSPSSLAGIFFFYFFYFERTKRDNNTANVETMLFASNQNHKTTVKREQRTNVPLGGSSAPVPTVAPRTRRSCHKKRNSFLLFIIFSCRPFHSFRLEQSLDGSALDFQFK